MKMVSNARAEKLAKLYVAVSEVTVDAGKYGVIYTYDPKFDELMSALADLDGGKPLTDPMQVLEGG